ncbi:AzlD domain-containing protein [Dactylosporangium sp. NPDC051485]|uniref:AzlD domain-containing protein n=1 Tax=Dactylosporangium sp. NPDC051485 TaxID=3154846 RepID=UPI00344A0A05
MSWIAIIALALGTYAFRFAGPVLRDRISVSEGIRRYLTLSAVALLAALIATAALLDGTHFVGVARPAGVLVGAVLAWRKAPFVVVVVAAALTAALLRVAGVE